MRSIGAGWLEVILINIGGVYVVKKVNSSVEIENEA